MQYDSLSLSQAGYASAPRRTPEESTQQQSLFSNMISSFTRQRITPIRSIKELASTYIRPALHRRTTSYTSNASTSPPPPYSEDRLSSEEDRDEEEEEEDMDTDFASAPSSRPSSSGSNTPIVRPSTDLLPRDSIQSAENLIRFKFANHGLMLVAQSAQESRASIHANDEYQRRLYLDGVSYLLRGLPEELSQEEVLRLKAVLPDVMKDSTQVNKPSTASAHTLKSQRRRLPLLRVVVQTIVFWLFYVLAITLPHLKRFARQAYAYERQHKIGEQFLTQALALTQIGYKQVLTLLCAVWAMNDGMVGRLLSEVGLWCAQNVSEGFKDGLAEAAAILRRTE